MARERLVTRTIVSTEVKALALNTETLVAETVTFVVPGEFEVGTKEIKAILEKKSDERVSYVKAIACTKIEKLYGMSESTFLQYAKELPPRTKTEADEA